MLTRSGVTEMTTRGASLTICVALGLVLNSVPHALAVPATPTIVHPDRTIKDFNDKNSSLIQKLLTSATDASLQTAVRVGALRQLTGPYFDFLLANAEGLVKDSDAGVVLTTVRLLGAEISMLPDHGAMG